MMLSYRAYVQEAVYKLTRQKSGLFNVLDPKLNETGITLDQNFNFGKDWDLMIEGKSKGSFKTKHDATTFIETHPALLAESYSKVFVDTANLRDEYIDDLWNMISKQLKGESLDEVKKSIESKKSLLSESKYWKLHIHEGVIFSASIYKDRGTKKLVKTLKFL